MASRALFRLPFAFLGLLVSSVHEDARQYRERSQDRGEPLDVLVEVDQHPTDGDHQHAEKKRGVLHSPFGCHIGAHDRVLVLEDAVRMVFEHPWYIVVLLRIVNRPVARTRSG